MKFPAVACALATLVFQAMSSSHAVPATQASPPWLDGRPTMAYVTEAPGWRPTDGGPLRYVRFDVGQGAAYGLLDGGSVRQLAGDLFASVYPTGLVIPESSVSLLSPIGPQELGRVAIVRPGADLTFVELGRRPISGHEEPLGLPGPLRVESVAAVIMGRDEHGGEGSAAAFGVTAGLLATTRAGEASLALGPSIVRGGRLADLRVSACAEAGSSGWTSETRVSQRLEVHALEQAAAAGLGRGDVILVSTAGEHGPYQGLADSRAVRVTASGVGDLRCRLT